MLAYFRKINNEIYLDAPCGGRYLQFGEMQGDNSPVPVKEWVISKVIHFGEPYDIVNIFQLS
jgi:hypothetical protein